MNGGKFADLQDDVLDWYGVDSDNEFIEITKPPLSIHYLTGGAGDPIVFVHGGGDESMIWAPLLARLQNEFSFFALDRPGHGLSDPFLYKGVNLRQHATEFICSSLDALNLDRTHLIACSAGAFFAFSAALDQPDRFKRVVFAGYPMGLIDAGPLLSSPPAIRRLRFIGGIPGLDKLFKLMQSRIDAETVRELYAEEFHADVSRYPDQYFQAWSEAVRNTGTMDSFMSFIKASIGLGGWSADVELLGEVSELQPPSLFLWGENDLASPDVGRSAVAAIPDATFEVVEGAGHFPFHDAPDWTAERIRNFLTDG